LKFGKTRYYLAYVLFCFSLFLKAQLNKIAEEWTKDESLKGAITSYCVYDYENDLVISEHNSETLMVPASTLKIFTTATTLKTKGNSFRFKTKFIYEGKINGSILEGNIHIVGSGDPTFGSSFFYKKESDVFTELINQLKQIGVTKITGNIIGDGSVWPKQIPANWIWGDISNYFGAVPNGLSFSDNTVKIHFKSQGIGQDTEINSTEPIEMYDMFHFQNSVKGGTKGDEAYIYGDPFGYDKEILGTIQHDKSDFIIKGSSPDPALQCAISLKNTLIENGINVHGHPLSSYHSDTLIKSNFICAHLSPALDKIIYYTNIASNNLFAESFIYLLGNGNYGAGLGAIYNYIKELKLNEKELYLSDGCGLARSNLVTTSLQAKFIAHQLKDPIVQKSFSVSLPIAGKQGSMRSIGKGNYIEGKMQAKTGYINHARGYSGFVKTKTGKSLSFSVLFNNYLISPTDAKKKIEKLLIGIGEL
jgi:D-alanyl-D-alanine carboxypeptidase/D-alanyl-D-alanine-endopeptidase (penicillin-binding protein 4)